MIQFSIIRKVRRNFLIQSLLLFIAAVRLAVIAWQCISIHIGFTRAVLDVKIQVLKGLSCKFSRRIRGFQKWQTSRMICKNCTMMSQNVWMKLLECPNQSQCLKFCDGIVALMWIESSWCVSYWMYIQFTHLVVFGLELLQCQVCLYQFPQWTLLLGQRRATKYILWLYF